MYLNGVLQGKLCSQPFKDIPVYLGCSRSCGLYVVSQGLFNVYWQEQQTGSRSQY